jgi:hypothetical protein
MHFVGLSFIMKRVDCSNKLRKKSASHLYLLSKNIKTHVLQNVKFANRILVLYRINCHVSFTFVFLVYTASCYTAPCYRCILPPVTDVYCPLLQMYTALCYRCILRPVTDFPQLYSVLLILTF